MTRLAERCGSWPRWCSWRWPSAGCAAHWAYRQGQEAGDKRDWDLAVARYTRALEKDPKNIGYKIALENARIQASRYHYDEAKKHLAANDFDKAAEELRDREQVRSGQPLGRGRPRDRARAHPQARGGAARAGRVRPDEGPRPGRGARAGGRPLAPQPGAHHHALRGRRACRRSSRAWGASRGSTCCSTRASATRRPRSNLTGVTFEEALDRLTFVNRLFYKVVDQNTLIVVPESRQKRVAYDELLLRTFYVQNAEINDTVNLVKTLAKVTTVAGNPSLGAITVLGTVDQIAMAERIIEANDKARGEVVVEVQILEVNRNNLQAVGDRPLELLGRGDAVAHRRGGRGRGRAARTSGRTVPRRRSTGRTGWSASRPRSSPDSCRATPRSALLAAPRLRAAEGKKAELKIGTGGADPGDELLGRPERRARPGATCPPRASSTRTWA